MRNKSKIQNTKYWFVWIGSIATHSSVGWKLQKIQKLKEKLAKSLPEKNTISLWNKTVSVAKLFLNRYLPKMAVLTIACGSKQFSAAYLTKPQAIISSREFCLYSCGCDTQFYLLYFYSNKLAVGLQIFHQTYFFVLDFHRMVISLKFYEGCFINWSLIDFEKTCIAHPYLYVWKWGDFSPLEEALLVVLAPPSDLSEFRSAEELLIQWSALRSVCTIWNAMTLIGIIITCENLRTVSRVKISNLLKKLSQNRNF